MGINHGRADVFVPKEFLDSADVVARLKQMCGKGMPVRSVIHFIILSFLIHAGSNQLPLIVVYGFLVRVIKNITPLPFLLYLITFKCPLR